MTKYYLTETRLKRIIKKSIKKILGEGIQIKHTPDKHYVTFDNSNNGIQDGPVVDTMKTLPESYSIYKNEINNKNVLLLDLDDSITLGQSVNSAVNALESCYIPQSISLLTMFSKLYKH